MGYKKMTQRLSSLKKILSISLGWAVFHSYLQFTVIITEGNKIMPIWFLMELMMAILASSLLDRLEQSLKTWIASVLFSFVLVTILLISPVYLGVLDPQFVSIIMIGSIQPIVTVLMLSAPLNLFGCFLGQILRNKLG